MRLNFVPPNESRRLKIGIFYFVLIFLILGSFLVVSAPLEVDFYKTKKSEVIINNDLDQTNLIFAEGLDLENNEHDQMIVNLCLGTPVQCFDVLVDSGSFLLWVSDKHSKDTETSVNRFDWKKSNTFSNEGIHYMIPYGTGSAEGMISKEKVTLGEMEVENFKFLLANKIVQNSNLDGILGLGYYYEDFDNGAVDFSLLDQLKDRNVIKSQMFTQKYTGNKQGKMFIGDLPEEISGDLENFGSCPALKTDNSGRLNPRWQCTLRGVFFGYENKSDQAINIDQPALFDTGTNLMIAPYEFMENLKNTYFKEMIDGGYCKFLPEGQFFLFRCSRTAPLINLPEFNFIFGEWVLKMKTQELFYNYRNMEIRFIFAASLNTDGWIIGEPLLKKFHFVFDKGSDLIGFYGKEDKFRSNMPFPNPYASLIILGIVLASAILIALIALAVYLYIKKRRSKLTYYDPSMYFNALKGSRNNNTQSQLL